MTLRRQVLGAMFLVFFACAQTPPAPVATAQASEAPGPRVTFPDGFVVRVEVAADDELRAQGLMFRDQLRPGTGMLFMFPGDGEYSFWMKNTRIALDMIWIDVAGKIVHVKHGVPPCEVEDCPGYAPGVPSRYVLEVASGVAKEHALADGQMLKIEGIEDVAPR